MKYKKIIAIVLVVVVFLGTSEAIHSMLVKYLSNGNSVTVPLPGSKSGFLKELEQNVQAIEELLGQILIKLERGEDFSSELADVMAARVGLQSLDIKVRQGFDDDESKLKATGFSEEIIDRHRDMVKNYNEKFEALMNGLAEIEESENDEVKLREKVNGLYEFVEKLQPYLRTIPLDYGQLPFRSAFKQAEEASSFSLSSVGLESISLASGDFTNADLSETVEVQFTQNITDLAANLGHNPVKIYEYVLNNFDFEVYYGSLKGAQETLWEMAGNDFDLASLLIALYRVSGIPARYVRGFVEVPIEQVKNWVGVNDSKTAADVFATGRVPCYYNVLNGKIVSLSFEHVWVKAYVDYIPSRGAVQVAGDTWVSLDPSFKQYVYVSGVNFTKEVPYDVNSFLNQLMGTATVNETGSYVTGFNASLISSEIDAYRTQVRSYLEVNMPDATLGEVLGERSILKKEYGILPMLPSYNVLSVYGEYSEVPDELRHKLTFELYDISLFGYSQSFSYTAYLPELAGKRITLSYLGATPNDEELIAQYENETVLPAYLINLKPVLRIDGNAIVNGSSVGMGYQQEFDLLLEAPYGMETAQKIVFAGAYYAVGLDLQRMPSKLMEKLAFNFDNIIAQNLAVVKTDDVTGEFLYSTAVSYFFEFDSLLDFVQRSFKVIDLRAVSVAMVSADINVTYSLWGTPYEAGLTGSFSIDVPRMVHSPFAVIADGNLTRNFMLVEGYLSSAMEHHVFEMLWRAYNVTAVSTVKVLQVANEQGIPIFRITSANLDEILPQLQHKQTVKNDIENAVYSGMVVTVPKTEITVGNWTGSGYVVEDPVTGAAAFAISSSLSGGHCTLGSVFALVLVLLAPWLGLPGIFLRMVLNIDRAIKKINKSFPEPGQNALATFGVAGGLILTGIIGVLLCAFALPVIAWAIGVYMSLFWTIIFNYVLDP